MNFDKDAFNSLIDNDKELFQSLLELFSQDWPMIIDQLKMAYESKDKDSVEQYGHRIKGNLKNFYATELSELALTIEEAGREGQFDDLSEKIETLEAGLRKLETELIQHYSSYQTDK